MSTPVSCCKVAERIVWRLRSGLLSVRRYKLLILANGAYGKRMAQIADYYHINYVLVSLHETELVTASSPTCLEEHPGITHLSMVQSETTTGC